MTTHRPSGRVAPVGPIPPLSALTPRELLLLDAWLETGSAAAAAKKVGCHPITARKVVKRYRQALRDVIVQIANEKVRFVI